MRRAVPVLLALVFAACGGGGEVDGPTTNPPPPPPPAPVPNALIIQAGNNQEAVPGEAVTTIPSVRVVDRNNQPMSGIPVTFAVDAGGGSVQGATATSGPDGTAKPTAWLLGALPGPNRLKATSGTLAPVEFTATGRYLIPTTPLDGTIGLPAGAGVSPASLRIQTGLMDVPAAGNGAFTGTVEPGVTTLASAVAGNGNPILFGWLDAQKRTLTVRTTAEVLSWFDVNGYLQPLKDARRIIREYLAGADLHELEAAITAALAADPGSVTLETPAIIAARKAVFQRLQASASQLRSGTPARIIVEPGATEKSGAIVDQQGLLGIITTNNWRRRVVSFVDRISYLPKGATQPISSINRGPGTRLGAVGAATSVIGTGIDIMFGNLPYTPVIAPPVQVTRFPADARSTLYRVTVVGPGRRASTVPLTPEQSDAMVDAGLETLFMEFVIPMLDQILSADNLSRDLGGAAELETALHKFLDLNPTSVLDAIEAGDMKAAFMEAMKLLFDSGAGQEFLAKTVLPVVANKFKVTLTEGMATRAKRWSRILTAIEIVATSVASAQVATDVWNASQGESWDVTVAGSEVVMDPKESTISQLDVLPIRARVLDNTEGFTFGYRFRTTGTAGIICVAQQQCGTELESSHDLVTYAAEPNKEGTDEVRVEVYIQDGIHKIVVGEATAKVTTFAIKVELSPSSARIKSGEFATFTAVLDPRFKQEGLITYRFATVGSLGYLGQNETAIESGDPTTTYTARMNVGGGEWVALEVFQTRDGVRRKLGSTLALVTVEKVKPTVVQGRYFTEVHPQPNNRICVGAYVAFPLVEGASHYEMKAYNFFDPAFYGAGFTRTILLASYPEWGPCNVKGLISGKTATEFIYMLSGGNGPASGAGNSVAQLDARFAGIKVDVTVKYPP